MGTNEAETSFPGGFIFPDVPPTFPGQFTAIAGTPGSLRVEYRDGNGFALLLFAGWETGGFNVSLDRGYEFVMSRGLNLTAVFIPNPFPALAGRYISVAGAARSPSHARWHCPAGRRYFWPRHPVRHALRRLRVDRGQPRG